MIDNVDVVDVPAKTAVNWGSENIFGIDRHRNGALDNKQVPCSTGEKIMSLALLIQG